MIKAILLGVVGISILYVWAFLGALAFVVSFKFIELGTTKSSFRKLLSSIPYGPFIIAITFLIVFLEYITKSRSKNNHKK